MTYEKVKELFNKINIDLSPEQYNLFSIYEKELLDWNEKINLTAITSDKEIWLKHFVDSCVISQYLDENSSLLDVGTGAGFPGVPCKIINESVSLTLLDSLNKRINFLSEMCGKLNLKNIDFVHGRAEEIAQDKKYREQYDVVTARAVANMATLCEYCLPFVKVGGKFICMKAGNVKEELNEAKNAIKTLGGEIKDVIEYQLPESNISRTIIIIKKVSKTDNLYPRKAGIPSKKPL